MQNIFKIYELDATRRDVCNTSGCQVPQCCDSNCHSDPCYGGGGTCFKCVSSLVDAGDL